MLYIQRVTTIPSNSSMKSYNHVNTNEINTENHKQNASYMFLLYTPNMNCIVYLSFSLTTCSVTFAFITMLVTARHKT